MITWMVYATIAAFGVLIAARAAEWFLRILRRPARLTWAGAALVSIILAATGPWRARGAHNEAASTVDLSSLAIVRTGIQSVERHMPARSLAPYVIGLWCLCSLAMILWFVGAYWQLRRARRSWPTIDLHGHRVRLSPATGPMVVGLVRPEIILPRWVLDRPIHDQRTIVEHEASHLSSGDPVLLAAACALVAAAPWNPAFWMMLARLRLAIEVDCDARVLRRGLSPLSYSSLLIDVAERATPTAFAAMGLADTSSHLYQRILAMESRRSNRLFLRAAGVAIIGLAGLLAACEAKMPTAADVEHMDASSAERSAKLLGVVTPDSALVWSVDGVASTEAAAKAIPADSIVTVNVGKFEGRSHIYMTTKGGQRTADAGRVDTVRMTVRHDGHVETVSTIRKPLDAKSSEGEPLLFIDGVRTDPSVLKTLDRTRIERVDVLKGELATRTYGADGSKGVIVITTKSR